MGTFADQIAAFTNKTQTRLDLYAEYVQSEAVQELQDALAKVLPGSVPVDTGLLRDSFTFRIEDDQLVVGNDAFYSVMLARFGSRHDVVEIIHDEAETITRSSDFLSTVSAKALARLS